MRRVYAAPTPIGFPETGEEAAESEAYEEALDDFHVIVFAKDIFFSLYKPSCESFASC